MSIGFNDRYDKIPLLPAFDKEANFSVSQDNRFQLSHNSKKSNPNKKNPVKYCLDIDVILNTTICRTCEHTFSCLACYSGVEIIEIRKLFCYNHDGSTKNETQIYESLINFLMKHQVKNYESLPHDKVLAFLFLVFNFFSHFQGCT
jgi:hypothetical protein